MARLLWNSLALILYGGTGFVIWQAAPTVLPKVASVITYLGFAWLTEGGIIPFLLYSAFALWVFSVERYSFRVLKQQGEDKGIGECLFLLLKLSVVTVLLSVLPLVSGYLVYKLSLLKLPNAPKLALTLGIIFGGGGSLGFVAPVLIRFPVPSRDKHVRGGQRISFAKARRLLQKKGEYSPWFGGVYLDRSKATQHFLYIGRTGAAKTFSMNALLTHVLPGVGKEPDYRAFIYDDKGTAIPFLNQIKVPWKLLNPFDLRSMAWDIEADCRDEAAVREIAAILLPERRESQPFFPKAAQELWVGIVMTFIVNAESWDLYDAVTTLRDQEKLKQLLSRTPGGRNLLELFFEMENELAKTGRDVRATAYAYLGQLATVAAAWRKLSEKNGKISLSEWANNQGTNNYVLILGQSHRNEAVMQAMYQLIFSRVVQEIESQTNSSKRRTWIVFDELYMAGKLPRLERLLIYGRTKGAAVVMGFQSWLGIEELYEAKIASQIIGQFGHMAFFRMDKDTAKKASEGAGDRQVERHRVSRSIGSEDYKVSTTHSWEERTEPVILPSELSGLPMPKPFFGLPGYYLSVDLDTRVGTLWRHTVSWLWVGWMRYRMYGERFFFFHKRKWEGEGIQPIPSEWATSGDWKFDREEGEAGTSSSRYQREKPHEGRGYGIIWPESSLDSSDYGREAEAEEGGGLPPM